MKIILSKHVRFKLGVLAKHEVSVKKEDIKRVVKNPDFHDYTDWPIITAMGSLDKTHSLIIIYRREEESYFIITCWPTKKGRYESKIQ